MRWLLLILCPLILLSCNGSKAPAITRDYALTRITPHVYVLHGPNESPNQTNQGFSNNPAIILTRAGVVVIDPGASVQVGELVVKKINEVTKHPVIAVFNTHVHGDHWLGNQAIKAAYPKAVIYAHPRMIEAIKTGAGDAWVKMINDATHGASRGTAVQAPELGVDNEDTLKLQGLTFRIYHNNRAHTETDLMIEVAEEGVMFLGDNVLNKRIAVNFPEQGNVQGQIAAIDMALKSKASYFVPGHGASGGREIAMAQQALLKSLRAAVKKYYEQGLTDFEMKEKVMNDLAAYKDWVDFDRLARVINAVYLQIESESF